MKKLFALSMALLLVFSMAPMAFAAESGEVLKTDVAPSIDGQIDDVWANANVYQMTNYTVAEKDNLELDPVKEPDDFSAQWRALWDDEKLYVLVEVTDDVLSEVNLIRDGGTQQRDDNVRIILGQEGNDHIQAIVHAVSEDLFHLFLVPSWSEVDEDEVEYAVHKTSDGYNVAMSIPWEVAGLTPLTPGDGVQFRFDVHAVDNDFLENDKNEIGVDGRYPQSRLTWSYDQDNDGTGNTGNPLTEEVGIITLTAPSSADEGDDGAADEPATGGETTPPATGGSGGNSGGGSSTPDMPRTGLGGTTDSNMAAWIMLAVFVVAIAGFGVMKLRRNN